MNIYKYTCFNLLDVYQFVSGYLQFDQWVMTIFETNFFGAHYLVQTCSD